MMRRSTCNRRWAALSRLGACAGLIGLSACASQPAARPESATEPQAGAAQSGSPIVVPQAIPRAIAQRQLFATGLLNPRGMQPLPSGALLVAEAGTGLPDDAQSGRLVQLVDLNGDGDVADEGERRPVLDHQPSKNILDIVRRDEVFGMGGIAEGDGTVLVGLAFFGGPSTVFEVSGDSATQWTKTHGNVNDLAYDARRKQWFAVGSTSDEIIRLRKGQGAERVIKLPPLENGQDAVPGYLRYDPLTDKIFVTLFSGSPEGEEGGLGVELQPRAGGIIAVDPDRGTFEWVIRGLSVPTDLEIAPDGTVYVLEFCDSFLDPAGTHEALLQRPNHGGFKRFSGRLLRIDRQQRAVALLAEGLDTPTNLALSGSTLYVAQGMGTPGRPIPGPHGVTPLTGFIESVALAP
jgi:glucose/arabinose dehydrogenase